MGRWLTGMLAGAVGAICVLALWLAVDFVVVDTIPRAEVPAWVQAVGSILAILVSAILAIFVPLYMRDLEEKGAVQRALNNCLYVVDQTGSAWESLSQILQSNAFHGSTPALLGEQTETARAIAAQTPVALLSPDAVLALSRARMNLQTLDIAVARLAKEKSPSAVLPHLPIAQVLQGLEEVSDLLEQMRPVKVAGHWMGAPKGWGRAHRPCPPKSTKGP